jgi:fructose-bisphosphate aldolase, class II
VAFATDCGEYPIKHLTARGANARRPMQGLRHILEQAPNGVAVGHFNVSDLVLLKAVFAAAHELNVPVIVGASKGERDFLGARQIANLVRSLREEFDFPIFLNADHTHSLTDAIESAKAGFDAIVFDVSSLPLEKNIRQTKEAVEALKAINSTILVEGEIGDIGTGSEIHEEAFNVSRFTTPAEAKEYVDSTRIDILAPAVGNMHGMLKSMVTGELKKRLDIERIAQIKSATQVPLTLHGGSGTDDDDLRKAIAAGINIVHINTELRIAWRHGLEEGLTQQPNEVVPYKILPFAVELVKQVVRSRLKLFNFGADPMSALPRTNKED